MALFRSGTAYAAYFEENQIIPFDPPQLPTGVAEDYVAARRRETHDVFHIVTGYGTDDIGELELQWFNLGNLGRGPLPILVIVASFFLGRMTLDGRRDPEKSAHRESAAEKWRRVTASRSDR